MLCIRGQGVCLIHFLLLTLNTGSPSTPSCSCFSCDVYFLTSCVWEQLSPKPCQESGGFNLHFSYHVWGWPSFHIFKGYFYILFFFFGVICSCFLPIFLSCFWLFYPSVLGVLPVLGILALYLCYILQTLFSLSLSDVFSLCLFFFFAMKLLIFTKSF